MSDARKAAAPAEVEARELLRQSLHLPLPHNMTAEDVERCRAAAAAADAATNAVAQRHYSCCIALLQEALVHVCKHAAATSGSLYYAAGLAVLLQCYVASSVDQDQLMEEVSTRSITAVVHCLHGFW
jgi:hypothetical protein